MGVSMILKRLNISIMIIILLIILCCITTILSFHFKAETEKYKQHAITNQNYYSSQEFKAKRNIEKAFMTLFNYDNNNFIGRFDEAKSYINESVVEKQKGTGGVIQEPTVQVKREVSDINIYRQMRNGKNITALVQMKSTYTVGGQKNPSMNELYRVKYNTKNNKIYYLEYLGKVNTLVNP